MARTPRETQEPEAFAFEMLRDFGNRMAEGYGLVFTLPQLALALRFVVWDFVAIGIYVLHVLALLVWTANAFLAR